MSACIQKKKRQVKAKAATTTASELVRKSILRVQSWTAKDKQTYKQRTIEITRIGSNLNQIARWCNTHKQAAEAVALMIRIQQC